MARGWLQEGNAPLPKQRRTLPACKRLDQAQGGALAWKGLTTCSQKAQSATTARSCPPEVAERKSTTSACNWPCPERRQIGQSSSSSTGTEFRCPLSTVGTQPWARSAVRGNVIPTHTQQPPGNSTKCPLPGTRCHPSPSPTAAAKYAVRIQVVVDREGTHTAVCGGGPAKSGKAGSVGY